MIIIKIDIINGYTTKTYALLKDLAKLCLNHQRLYSHQKIQHNCLITLITLMQANKNQQHYHAFFESYIHYDKIFT